MKTKRRPAVTLKDLSDKDINLLAQAANAPENTLFCFGHSYGKLNALKLIDQENNVTYMGKKFLRGLSDSN